MNAATPAMLDAAARALHRFNAPRVGNGIENYDTLGAASQSRWLQMASRALDAARLAESREAETPVVEVRG